MAFFVVYSVLMVVLDLIAFAGVDYCRRKFLD